MVLAIILSFNNIALLNAMLLTIPGQYCMQPDNMSSLMSVYDLIKPIYSD